MAVIVVIGGDQKDTLVAVGIGKLIAGETAECMVSVVLSHTAG